MLSKGTLISSFVCFHFTCKINFALYMGKCAVVANKIWLRPMICNKFQIEHVLIFDVDKEIIEQ